MRRIALVSGSIDVECHFINGSDAQGCEVVVVSDHSSVGNITTMLIRHNKSDTTVSGQVNLTYHIDCYHHVLAFDIEANGTISNLATREKMELNKTVSRCRITVKGVLFSNIHIPISK